MAVRRRRNSPLRRWREDHDLTAAELATLAGIYSSDFSKMETGAVSLRGKLRDYLLGIDAGVVATMDAYHLRRTRELRRKQEVPA
jgi:transcriptional regulator with XRE-family HTH domain